jgi:hypothetical protein
MRSKRAQREYSLSAAYFAEQLSQLRTILTVTKLNHFIIFLVKTVSNVFIRAKNKTINIQIVQS